MSSIEHATDKASWQEIVRRHQNNIHPPPPSPLIAENKDLREKLSRSKEHMAKLMDAIQRDLALIRSKCKDCNCAKDIPAMDCPNLTMHKTMSAVVHIAMENMGE